MSRYIDILITAPPSIDFPSLVGAQDEHGQPVQVGEWIGPAGDMPFWRYRLTAAELLMYLIADTEQLIGMPIGEMPVLKQRSTAQQIIDGRAERGSPAISARAALKAKLAGAKPKSAATPPADAPPDPLATSQCPSCFHLYNPALHQLVDCGTCGNSKCTARCFGNTTEPCLDCQALAADAEEGGYEPPEMAEIRTPELRGKMAQEAAGVTQAVASRLFDNIHHAKGGVDSAADEEDE